MTEEESVMAHKGVAAGKAASLEKFSKEGLAAWQSQWKKEDAYYLLAEKEWERRFVKEAAFWQRISAWIGVVAAVVGALIAILGAIAAKLLGFT